MVILYCRTGGAHLRPRQVRGMAERKYARKYLRIKPGNPLHADVAIVRVGRDAVRTGTARVRVLDISPGGLRFTSVLNLPVTESVLLELHFQLSGADYRMRGCIVHKNSPEVKEYEYGLRFLEPDGTLRISLRKLFGGVQVSLEKHIVILRFN